MVFLRARSVEIVAVTDQGCESVAGYPPPMSSSTIITLELCTYLYYPYHSRVQGGGRGEAVEEGMVAHAASGLCYSSILAPVPPTDTQNLPLMLPPLPHCSKARGYPSPIGRGDRSRLSGHLQHPSLVSHERGNDNALERPPLTLSPIYGN